MEIQKVIDYWQNESAEDLKVSGHLFEKGDYSYALFFCHLAIEKYLKAIYVKEKHEQPPHIHNLIRIAELSGINVPEEIEKYMIRITAFNIEARYPDDKNNFRKKCTAEFTRNEIEKVEKVMTWLKSIHP